jgi:hypothetical protein
MKAICGKCKARVNVNTAAAESSTVRFICPICKTRNKLVLKKEAPKPKITSDKTQIHEEQDFDTIMGWIVVHDENTPQQTHNLKLGKNIVGRKSDSLPCDIMIETSDKFMSRNHFAIEISRGAMGLKYLVYDVTSTNGTFINADSKTRLNTMDKVFLKDNDTIQAGRTKMVLRTKKMAGTARNATNTVISTTPMNTIICT